MADHAAELAPKTHRRSRLVLLGVPLCIVAIAIGVVSVWQQVAPDCHSLSRVSASELAAGSYRSAYDRLRPAAAPCTQHGSEVERFRFYDRLATSAFAVGDRAEAKRYAEQAMKVNLSSEQSGQVQQEGIRMNAVLYDEYSVPSPQGGERKEQQQ